MLTAWRSGGAFASATSTRAALEPLDAFAARLLVQLRAAADDQATPTSTAPDEAVLTSWISGRLPYCIVGMLGDTTHAGESSAAFWARHVAAVAAALDKRRED